LRELSKAVKGWKVLVEGREGEGLGGGLLKGGGGDVPSSVFYRLGRCSEDRGDLAAAEKFYTWAVEVPVVDHYSAENLKFVVEWAGRDMRKTRKVYGAVKRKRRKLVRGPLGLGDMGKEFEEQLEEELAFSARSYMLHSRLAKYGDLMVGMMEGGLGKGGEGGKGVSGAMVMCVERGWEGRMVCKMAGRDAWQGVL